jgi:hypothetical protein
MPHININITKQFYCERHFVTKAVTEQSPRLFLQPCPLVGPDCQDGAEQVEGSIHQANDLKSHDTVQPHRIRVSRQEMDSTTFENKAHVP